MIGNPPYKSLTKNNTDNDTLKTYNKTYESLKHGSSKNLFTLFIESAITIFLRKQGVLSFIIPEGLFKTRSYSDCTKVMNSLGATVQTVTFSNYVFENAITGSLIFVYVKDMVLSTPSIQYQFDTNNKLNEIKSDNTTLLIEKIARGADKKNLNEVAILFKGMVVQDRKNVVSYLRADNPDVFLLGKNITRWIVKSEGYTGYSKLVIVGGTKKLDKHNHVPRILIRRTGDKLCCSYLENKALTESTLYSCWSIEEDLVDNFYLIGILNSKLMNYYNQKMNITNQQGFPQILMTDLKMLPIKIAKYEQQVSIRNLVNKILCKKKYDPECCVSQEEKEIDNIVYQLYGLTDEETRIIKGR